MKGFMKLISGVFHPLLMASYSCILLYFYLPSLFSPISYETIPFFILAVFLTTAVIPGLSVMMMKWTKKVSDLDIMQRDERRVPFLTIATFYAMTTFLLETRINLSKSLLVMMISVTALIFLIYIISLRFKISVHAAATWGVAGIFSSILLRFGETNLLILTGAIFLVAGFTTSSRIYLARHTEKEAWAGSLLGFVFCFLGFTFFA